jgi:hypothetical protein
MVQDRGHCKLEKTRKQSTGFSGCQGKKYRDPVYKKEARAAVGLVMPITVMEFLLIDDL